MQTSTSIQYKKIKRGNIIKNVHTKLLREDIPCGISECNFCEENPKQLTLERPLFILTSSLILTQIDAIENFPLLDNCILPQSEYNILLNQKHSTLHKRFALLLENRSIEIYPNEYNKEIASIPNESSYTKTSLQRTMLTNTISYFIKHISSFNNAHPQITVLCDNIDNDINVKSIQFMENVTVHIYTLLDFAKNTMNESPDLFNYLAYASELNVNEEMESEMFKKHVSDNEMKANVKKAVMFQGVIMFQPGILDTATVSCSLFDKNIVIEGKDNLNRAMHGDVVCFTLLPESKWKKTETKDNNAISMMEENVDGDGNEGEIVVEENNDSKNIQEKIKSTTKQPLGFIEGILRRKHTVFCGTIYNANNDAKNQNEISQDEVAFINNINNTTSNNNNNSTLSVFIPIDNKYPNFLINLHKQNSYFNQRILIQYDTWSTSSLLPRCHFIKKIGPCFEVPVENDIILYEHNVDINPFSKRIIDSMPREDTEFKCPEDELLKRKDLRDRIVCSIDPPGCKDIDDALHCMVNSRGNLEVGVHIADVTHYVKPNDEVDRIASKNCNTIYLVHKRTDMLPKVLTENLCSLVGGKERLAFSVLWEMNPQTYEILNVEYTKSVIKSKAALTYEKANNIIHDHNDQSDLAKGIRYLNNIAKHLKQQRLLNGALILASNEMKFNLDSETNTINDICMYPTYETNSLVEEFMLLANVWVAKKIYEAFPSCAVLRRHPPPKEKELKAFVELLAERGFSLNTTNSLELGHSLNMINKPNDPFFNKLIRSLLTRTMNQAKYFSSCAYSYEEFYHYGLAMEIYTHFTSPIRRYSDVLVHRLLAAALEIDYLPEDMSNKSKLERECLQMNRQNRVGFFCGRASNYFSAFIYFNEHRETCKGIEIVIHSIDNNFIKGISVKYGIEGNICFEEGKNGIKEIDVEKKCLVLNNGDVINLFDHVNVEIRTIVFNYRYEIKYYYVNKI